MFITDSTIERWIEEDVPGLDLTSHLLGVEKVEAAITFSARNETALCGVEEAAAVFRKLGARVELLQCDGAVVQKGTEILRAFGNGGMIHAGWRVALNLIEYASGIATRTSKMVQQARLHGDVLVCGTRKAFPGGRKISQKALMAGGGVPHRLGLGETVLIFPHHYNLIGLDNFLKKMPEIKRAAREKKIGIEVESLEQAELMASHGADIIQLDKCSAAVAAEVVAALRPRYPNLVIGAAGGVNADNAAEYAATGVDMLVTSWMYFGKPADIKAVIER